MLLCVFMGRKRKETCIAPLWVEEKKPKPKKEPKRVLWFYVVNDYYCDGEGDSEYEAYFSDLKEAEKEFRKRVRKAKREQKGIDREHRCVTETEHYFDFYNSADDWQYIIQISVERLNVTGDLELCEVSEHKSELSIKRRIPLKPCLDDR